MIFQNPILSDDSLRAALDTVLAAPEYRWAEPTARLSWLARWWQALTEWLGRLRETNPEAAQLLFWGLLTILVAIFVHGGWLMYRTIRGASASENVEGAVGAVVIRDEAWYQRLAERLAAEGRFVEAMHAAFTAMVLRLDARGVLRYHPSKTPREYLGEARLGDEAKRRLRETVGTLYACAYAGRHCGPQDYREWVSGLGREWYATQG